MAKPVATSNKRIENWLSYGGVFAMWILSIGLAFHAQNTQALQHYHLSRAGLHVILAVLELPTLFIWAAMLFAALSFYRYARQIKGSKDSPGFRYIAVSFAAMLFSSIVGSLISNVQALASDTADNPQLVKQHFVILSNYVAVAMALVIYGYLFKGSQSLLASLEKRSSVGYRYLRVLLPVVVLGLVYVGLIFANPDRRVVTDPLKSPTFGLPDPLILLTVALPYVASWALGLLALDGLYRYREQTPGVVYKFLFHSLTKGMTLVIVLTIVLQILTQFSSSLSAASLGVILGLIAIIYIILIIALLYVARGARQLNKIETLDLEIS